MRTVWAILVALVGVGVAPTALAAGPRPPPPPRIGMEMEYTRNLSSEDECPPLSKMRLYLINEYAYDPFDLSKEDVHIHVRLTLSLKGGVYHGEYTVTPANGEPAPVQKMDHPQCSELLKNIANAIPIDTFILFPTPRQQPPPLPALPPPAAPLPPAPVASSSTLSIMPPPPQRADRTPEPHPPASPRSFWVAGIGPAVVVGLVPSVGLGGSIFVAHQWDDYSAGLEVGGFSSIGNVTEGLARRRGTFFDVTVVPCRKLTHLPSFAISLCASVGLGTETLGITKTLHDDLHLESTPSHDYYSMEVGARGRVEWPLGRRFALGASIEVGTRVWSRTASVPSPAGEVEDTHDQSNGYSTLPQILTPILSGGIYWAVHM